LTGNLISVVFYLTNMRRFDQGSDWFKVIRHTLQVDWVILGVADVEEKSKASGGRKYTNVANGDSLSSIIFGKIEGWCRIPQWTAASLSDEIVVVYLCTTPHWLGNGDVFWSIRVIWSTLVGDLNKTHRLYLGIMTYTGWGNALSPRFAVKWRALINGDVACADHGSPVYFYFMGSSEHFRRRTTTCMKHRSEQIQII